MTVSSPPSVMSVHEQDVRCGALRHHRHSPSSALPRCHHAVTVDVAHVARGPRTRAATFDIDVALAMLEAAGDGACEQGQRPILPALASRPLEMPSRYCEPLDAA